MFVDTFKCTSCGCKCYNSDTIYPTLVFSDDENKVCEDCSIDYEEVNGKIQLREDIAAWMNKNIGVMHPIDNMD